MVEAGLLRKQIPEDRVGDESMEGQSCFNHAHSISTLFWQSEVNDKAMLYYEV